MLRRTSVLLTALLCVGSTAVAQADAPACDVVQTLTINNDSDVPPDPLFADGGSGAAPYGIDIDSSGNIYTGQSQGLGTIFRFDPEGAQTLTVGFPPQRSIDGVAVGDDGTVYVDYTWSLSGRIEKFDATGASLGYVEGPSSPVGDRWPNPRGLDVHDETVYMAASTAAAIITYDTDLSPESYERFIQSADTTPAFNVLWDVAVADDGTIYAVGNYDDDGTSRAVIYVFDENGNQTSAIIGSALSSGAHGIAVDGSGNIYVSDTGTAGSTTTPDASAGVYGFRPNGDLFMTLNNASSPAPDPAFIDPLYIAVSDDGTDIYLSDRWSRTVYRFNRCLSRYAGVNRYGTAASIAAADFDDPDAVSTVFVAVGSDYPDALAGAAVAGKLGAPLLLVQPDTIPGPTLEELSRLEPDTIVILGGTAVVSDDVATQLGSLAFGPTVERLAGTNRYATSVAISLYGFPSGSTEVIVATGYGFADALAGGPAAVALDAPVLLTAPETLPGTVWTEIQRLAPSRIVVIGGTAAVSDAVFQQLQAIQSNTVRVSGANRYATAVAMSQDAFPSGADRVYVATGANFPDALAGAAAAGSRSAPILLVASDSVPGPVVTEITRLGAGRVIVLGGTAVVAEAIALQLGVLVGL